MVWRVAGRSQPVACGQAEDLFWLEVEQPERFSPDRFPVFINDWPGTEFYGFPIFEDPGLKVAVHTGGQLTSPDAVDRTVQDDEKEDVVPYAQRLFEGITGRVVSSTVCLYTMSPDEDFIVDRHPRWPHVVFGAGFSGHGFKFATAIGEHLVDLAFDLKHEVVFDFVTGTVCECGFPKLKHGANLDEASPRLRTS